jgi:hypothetical protein
MRERQSHSAGPYRYRRIQRIDPTTCIRTGRQILLPACPKIEYLRARFDADFAAIDDIDKESKTVQQSHSHQNAPACNYSGDIPRLLVPNQDDIMDRKIYQFAVAEFVGASLAKRMRPQARWPIRIA